MIQKPKLLVSMRRTTFSTIIFSFEAILRYLLCKPKTVVNRGKGASAGRLREVRANTGLRRQEWKLRPVLARARPEPACLPFSSLRVTLVAAGVNPQTTGLSHFYTSARF
jgi:hypothetical protein